MQEIGSKNHQINTFPLQLCHCENCNLTQIGTRLDREVVFPDSYPYLSGTTKSLVANFGNQAAAAIEYLNLKSNDLVVDIGSNDGSLLKQYSGVTKVIGIEPTQAARKANENGINTLNIYFDAKACEEILDTYGKARLVTACNVFAHIDDLASLMQNIMKILDNDGVFISESHYLLDLIETNQFDTIYHEHLRYYSVTFLVKLFKKFNLEIFRVDSIHTHGGSIRAWAGRVGGNPIQPSVDEFISKEIDSNILNLEGLNSFAQNVVEWRNDFRKLISEIKLATKNISGVGSPSRASTLISFAGLTHLDLVSIAEVKNSAKIGKYLPGTLIPVLDEEIVLSNNPEYLLLLSWHLADEIILAIRKKGFKGKFIVPLPKPRIIE
jgi:SAM-dependent methyltransferase